MNEDASRTIRAQAAEVAAALADRGISSVLSGGAAVAIYSNGRYLSKDLDFVTSESLKAIRPARARTPTK